MSDEPKRRETIAALSGSAETGNAWLQAALLESQIEITVTEEAGAESSIVLSRAQVIDLARLLMAAMDRQPSFPCILKCCECDEPATCHVTELLKGEPIILHLCERHAHRHNDQVTRKPPKP
jgi:hypothetical protein